MMAVLHPGGRNYRDEPGLDAIRDNRVMRVADGFRSARSPRREYVGGDTSLGVERSGVV